jgi:hypothetical protein
VGEEVVTVIDVPVKPDGYRRGPYGLGNPFPLQPEPSYPVEYRLLGSGEEFEVRSLLPQSYRGLLPFLTRGEVPRAS